MSRVVMQIREQPTYRRDAFVNGLKRLGYTQFDDYRCGRGFPSGPDDLLVLWNLHRGPDESYAKAWEAKGGTVLVCENGYLQRQDKTYYAISVHGHNGSGWFPAGDGAERFARLGFELKPQRTDAVTGGCILVRGQRGIGSALMASPPHWHVKHAARLRAKGMKDVVEYAHPGDKRKLESDAKQLARASWVHIWSSAIGVRALVEGIPVEFHAPKWICAGWRAGREVALHNMACGQWHHDEIASGEPFARMKAEGWGIFTGKADPIAKATAIT